MLNYLFDKIIIKIEKKKKQQTNLRTFNHRVCPSVDYGQFDYRGSL